MTQTVKRSDLRRIMADRLGINEGMTSDILEDLLAMMAKGLVEDQRLKLPSFGSFYVRKKRSRMGRNPKTGQEAIISPRYALSFVVSQRLLDKMAKQSTESS